MNMNRSLLTQMQEQCSSSQPPSLYLYFFSHSSRCLQGSPRFTISFFTSSHFLGLVFIVFAKQPICHIIYKQYVVVKLFSYIHLIVFFNSNSYVRPQSSPRLLPIKVFILGLCRRKQCWGNLVSILISYLGHQPPHLLCPNDTQS